MKDQHARPLGVASGKAFRMFSATASSASSMGSVLLFLASAPLERARVCGLHGPIASYPLGSDWIQWFGRVRLALVADQFEGSEQKLAQFCRGPECGSQTNPGRPNVRMEDVERL